MMGSLLSSGVTEGGGSLGVHPQRRKLWIVLLGDLLTPTRFTHKALDHIGKYKTKLKITCLGNFCQRHALLAGEMRFIIRWQVCSDESLRAVVILLANYLGPLKKKTLRNTCWLSYIVSQTQATHLINIRQQYHRGTECLPVYKNHAEVAATRGELAHILPLIQSNE